MMKNNINDDNNNNNDNNNIKIFIQDVNFNITYIDINMYPVKLKIITNLDIRLIKMVN